VTEVAQRHDVEGTGVGADVVGVEGVGQLQRLKVVERGRPRVAESALPPRRVDGGCVVLERVVHKRVEKRAGERDFQMEAET
jgi:hypothetical protein